MDQYFSEQQGMAMILMAATQTTFIVLMVLTVLLLGLSFFISGAEIAFFSLNYRDINSLKRKKDEGWKRIATLLEDPQTLHATLLFANSLVNIACIILSNLLIDQAIPFLLQIDTWLRLLIKVPMILSLILLFGEILPKIRAAKQGLRIAYQSSFLVSVIYSLFKRPAKRLLSITQRVEQFMGGGATRSYTHQQMEDAIKLTVDQEGERRILTGIYNFRHITVKQIMRSRLDVSGIPYDLPFADLKQKIEELHYSRLPVYRTSLDEIAGMIHTKDLIPSLQEPDDFDWRKLMRAPYFVHEQKFIEDLLKEFQSKRIHFAVVVDEFGGTSGIVTLEDILEEIIGEIKDEFDEEETIGKRLDDGSYILEGRMMIHDACNFLGLSSDTFDKVKGESDSIAGLMLEIAGKFPEPMEELTAGDFKFTVLEIQHNRIQKVKLSIQTI